MKSGKFEACFLFFGGAGLGIIYRFCGSSFNIFTLALDIGGQVYYNYLSNIKEGILC